ncbi:putative protein phosphatase 2C 3 [Sesamum angolense]|uniref:PPM-type phosphatase domain-containing protein n=1 Tax=Sesamum angolense TaxID=2727404 RepID=A0AAE1XD18_9LAMI|nr:putative protein phosphatase 2C 3 [Sesamum angolense]
MGSREERHRHHHDLVPLAALISRELKNEKMEKPTVRYGSAAQSRKGEDYFLMKTDCQRVPGNPSTFFSVFGVLSKTFLIFVTVERKTSGTTATFVIVDGWTVTVASVGDSRCILDAQGGGGLSVLTVDHRLEENAEERERVTASGGEVGRLSIFGGTEVGPLRCWPGGLCLSRSIGDMDLSSTGGRLIIASDGIWDALSSEMAAKSCRGLPAELAAASRQDGQDLKQKLNEALRTRGLKDDTTCIVVDIIPPDNRVPPPPTPKKYTKLKALLFRKKSYGSANKLSMKLSSVGIVEELFEEGSAMLAERLGNDDTSGQTSSLFVCAVCQADLAPNEGISVHAGSIFSVSSKPWQGPFLCADCRNKKDAMEGKRPSGVRVV